MHVVNKTAAAKTGMLMGFQDVPQRPVLIKSIDIVE